MAEAVVAALSQHLLQMELTDKRAVVVMVEEAVVALARVLMM